MAKKARSGSRRKRQGRRSSDINQCLIRLKRMVPTARGHTKINKLELLQHVIDYIQDLEITLEEDHLRLSSISGSPHSAQLPISVSRSLLEFLKLRFTI
uniref:BHLH domain-containing protein n=1 Tax=Mesocestoides corti TaxID=53468 RepID=A0A5K3F099_MESCO